MSVHPGAFCSPLGAAGDSAKGTPMACTIRQPGERARWRRADGGTGKPAKNPATEPEPTADKQPTSTTQPQPQTDGDRAVRDTYDRLVAARPRSSMHLDPWIDLGELDDTMPARFRAGLAQDDRGALSRLEGNPNVIVDRDNNRIMFRDAAQRVAAQARKAEQPPEPRTVPEFIRDAYERILADRDDRRGSGRQHPGSAAVQLADLRRALPGFIRRADVDAALGELFLDPDVFIEAEANQKTLLPRDRDASITFGNQAKHLIVFRDVEKARADEYYARRRSENP